MNIYVNIYTQIYMKISLKTDFWKWNADSVNMCILYSWYQHRVWERFIVCPFPKQYINDIFKMFVEDYYISICRSLFMSKAFYLNL